MTQPTGVFVRLPLSENAAETLAWDADCGNAEDALLAIGTPVTGGELEVVGYIPEHPCLTKRDGTNASTFEDRENKRHTVPLVSQSDALAKLAQKDAEIARLNEELSGFRAGLSELVAKEVAALKGPEA